MLAQLQSSYPEDVRIVYRHFPLISIHDKAALATQASEAAGAQGEFWAMHDILFERQAEWAALSVEGFQDWLAERADELGLDIDQFSAIIQPPEAAILAVAGIKDKVVARNDEMVIRPVMSLTLSIDHRVLDGALGAQFLQTVKNYIENPVSLIF